MTSARPLRAGDAVLADGDVQKSEETGMEDSVTGDAMPPELPSEEGTLPSLSLGCEGTTLSLNVS